MIFTQRNMLALATAGTQLIRYVVFVSTRKSLRNGISERILMRAKEDRLFGI